MKSTYSLLQHNSKIHLPTQKGGLQRAENFPVLPNVGQKFMRYFGVSLQFFAVFINFYLFPYSTIFKEGTYSILRNSGCKTLGLDSDIFVPRGPGFNRWAVHGGTCWRRRGTPMSLPEHSSFALNSHSASTACHHRGDTYQPIFGYSTKGFPHCYKHSPH
jgi:hypothetical protein